NWKQRRLVARGFLESAIATLDEPRYLQALYGWMSRNAEMTGDSESADTWIALCDPAPLDLEMDSAVRFTWASLAMRRGDFEGVLKILGRSRSAFPLLSKFDSTCDIFRAHAKEMLEGVEAGTAHLLAAFSPRRALAPKRRDWLGILDSVEASPTLDLCPRSLAPAVLSAWKWWPKPILGTLVFVIFAAALLSDAILGPWLWGERKLGYGAIPIGLFVGPQLFVYAYLHVSYSKRIRRRLREVEGKRVRPSA
ncbi:MAG: hypothetical protein KJO07_03020, partial [Deltaproteobacteria bacterium]|nr:hypothetical protein [Deltaproteobacteria bacterium]